MPLFRCDRCGAVENTATSNYWLTITKKDQPHFCSECDPEIGKWHGLFPKEDATKAGYLLGNDGYLYEKEYVNTDNYRWREQYQGFKILGPA